MVPDYHIHTPLCRHATGKLSDYVRMAATGNMDSMCFSDHAPAPSGYDSRFRMDISQFPEYKRLVAEARQETDIEVLFGIEADYYEGCEAFLREWLPAQEFDIVLGSVHYIGNWAFDNPEEIARWDTVDVETVWKQYFEILARLAKTRMYDVVSHIDLPKKFGHTIPDERVRAVAGPALDSIAEAGMAIELNTSGLSKPAGEIYPGIVILSMARERGIPVCFGSDSHSPREVGRSFADAVSLARSAGHTESARFHQRQKRMCKLPDTHTP